MVTNESDDRVTSGRGIVVNATLTRDGSPVDSVPVDFSTTSGCLGSFSPTDPVTDGMGRASTTYTAPSTDEILTCDITVTTTHISTSITVTVVPDTDDTSLRTPNSTGIILHQVLVTFVQAEELPPETSDEETGSGPVGLAPTGNLLITLALDPVDAERLVFTAEHGTVWLAREGPDVDDSPTEIQTRASVYVAQ